MLLVVSSKLSHSFFLPTTRRLYYKGQWLPAHCILKASSQQVVLWAGTAVPHSSLVLNFAAVESWLGNDFSLLENYFTVLVLKDRMISYLKYCRRQWVKYMKVTCRGGLELRYLALYISVSTKENSCWSTP